MMNDQVRAEISCKPAFFIRSCCCNNITSDYFCNLNRHMAYTRTYAPHQHIFTRLNCCALNEHLVSRLPHQRKGSSFCKGNIIRFWLHIFFIQYDKLAIGAIDQFAKDTHIFTHILFSSLAVPACTAINQGLHNHWISSFKAINLCTNFTYIPGTITAHYHR